MLENISRPISLARQGKKKHGFGDCCFIIFFSCEHEIHQLHQPLAAMNGT